MKLVRWYAIWVITPLLAACGQNSKPLPVLVPTETSSSATSPTTPSRSATAPHGKHKAKAVTLAPSVAETTAQSALATAHALHPKAITSSATARSTSSPTMKTNEGKPTIQNPAGPTPAKVSPPAHNSPTREPQKVTPRKQEPTAEQISPKTSSAAPPEFVPPSQTASQTASTQHAKIFTAARVHRDGYSWQQFSRDTSMVNGVWVVRVLEATEHNVTLQPYKFTQDSPDVPYTKYLTKIGQPQVVQFAENARTLLPINIISEFTPGATLPHDGITAPPKVFAEVFNTSTGEPTPGLHVDLGDDYKISPELKSKIIFTYLHDPEGYAYVVIKNGHIVDLEASPPA